MQEVAYRLIVRRGPQPNQVYELSGEVTNLGRDITNDIVINDREASRHHLRLMRGTDGYTIEDLGSTNGTFINGKRVSGAIPLKNGDMVGLGETVTLQFEVARPGAAAEPPQPVAQPTAPSVASGEEDRFRPQPAAQENPYQPQPAASETPQPQYGGDQQFSAGAPAQSAYGPPPPGYDYDPYAMREEEGSNTMQWLMIGCLGLILLCCCMTVILAVAVDTFCMYDSIPGLTSFLGSVGLSPAC